MKQFIKPEFTLLKEEQEKHYGNFLVEPLERGFGITLGNAIRRTLLSSTPGAAVYAIKIAGAVHEFTSIPGIVENVSRIILNIKQLILKIDNESYPSEETVVIKIKTSTSGLVKASDLDFPAGVEVINPELVIATVAEGGVLDLTLFAKNSRGYRTFEDNGKEKLLEVGTIAIDSNYSPVTKVAFNTTETKIGQSTIDLEKLEIQVTTNGAITPVEAISIAAKVLTSHLEFFVNLSNEIDKLEIIGTSDKEERELERTIEELEFSQRSLNCLKRNDINTLRDLVSKTEDEIQDIKNLGRKSLKEIKDKVLQQGLTFKQV